MVSIFTFAIACTSSFYVKWYFFVELFLCFQIITFKIFYFSGKNDPKKMNPKLFLPLLDNKIFPERVQRFFRFGVAEYKPDNTENINDHSKIIKERLLLKHNGKDKEDSEKKYTTFDEKKFSCEETDINVAV